MAYFAQLNDENIVTQVISVSNEDLLDNGTESEDKGELDRFCDALISIRMEIKDVEEGKVDKKDNILKRAPHTQQNICGDVWDRPYSRQQAAFPAVWVHHAKFWPSIGRVNNTYGDRNLVCTCEPVSSYEEQ